MQIGQRRKKIQKQIQKTLKKQEALEQLKVKQIRKENYLQSTQSQPKKICNLQNENLPFKNILYTKNNFKRSDSLSTICTRSNEKFVGDSNKKQNTQQLFNNSQFQNATNYSDSILQTLIGEEHKWVVQKPQNLQQREINTDMRKVLVQWLTKVHQTFSMNIQTLFRALLYLEKFASLIQIQRNQYQLIGSTCLLIAAKFEEIFPPKIKQFVYMCDQAFSQQQFIKCESLVLSVLNYDILNVTPVSYLQILKAKNLVSSQNIEEIKSALKQILLSKECFQINPRALLIAVITLVNRNTYEQVQLKEVCSKLNFNFDNQDIFHAISFINSISNQHVLKNQFFNQIFYYNLKFFNLISFINHNSSPAKFFCFSYSLACSGVYSH